MCWFVSIFVGVDPGSRQTGVCVVDGVGVPLRCFVLENGGCLLPPPVGYVRGVVDAVAELVGECGGVVCVEGVNRPSWHVAKGAKRGAASNPEALLGTAVVLGGVMAVFPDCVIVEPGKNGSKPLGAYPESLVSTGEKRTSGWQTRVGAGKMRHVRSAYDIAVRGARMAGRVPSGR